MVAGGEAVSVSLIEGSGVLLCVGLRVIVGSVVGEVLGSRVVVGSCVGDAVSVGDVVTVGSAGEVVVMVKPGVLLAGALGEGVREAVALAVGDEVLVAVMVA